MLLCASRYVVGVPLLFVVVHAKDVGLVGREPARCCITQGARKGLIEAMFDVHFSILCIRQSA